MKLLIHKTLSLITKTRIRGLDAFTPTPRTSCALGVPPSAASLHAVAGRAGARATRAPWPGQGKPVALTWDGGAAWPPGPTCRVARVAAVCGSSLFEEVVLC